MPEPICPNCGSYRIEKLVLISKKTFWGYFIRDQDICSMREDCMNAGSGRCNICHREYAIKLHYLSRVRTTIITATEEGEMWCQFKDKEYYRETLPFIEVKWLFEKLEGV